jgi:cysteine desulfurase/selenocysteine lyase
MEKIDGLTYYGPKDADQRVGVIAFNLGDIHAHDLASILDEEGIAIRSGHHCAQPLMEFLDIPAASRASFYVYNTKEEVDILINALEKARKLFKV